MAAALLSGLLVAGAASASPVTYFLDGGGLVDASGCTSAACPGIADITFDNVGGPFAMGGSVTLDDVALTLSLDLTLAALPMLEIVVGSDNDNGVESLDFASITYSAAGIPVIPAGPVFILNPLGPPVTFEAMLTQLAPGGGVVSGPTAISLGAVSVSGTCTVAGDSINCLPVFGRTGFEIGIGAPASAVSRFFKHDANFTATVPEPAVALLVGLGIGGLGLAARRGRARH